MKKSQRDTPYNRRKGEGERSEVNHENKEQGARGCEDTRLDTAAVNAKGIEHPLH